MSDDVNLLPPAGWYGDPQDQASLRYWDGAQWTDQTRPIITEPAVTQAPVQAPAQVQPEAVVQAPVQTPAFAERAPAEVGAGLAESSGPPVLIVTMNDIPGYRITNVIGEICGVTSGYRKEAVNALKTEAAIVGANAVVAMRYAGQSSELTAYGTAVLVEPV